MRYILIIAPAEFNGSGIVTHCYIEEDELDKVLAMVRKEYPDRKFCYWPINVGKTL